MKTTQMVCWLVLAGALCGCSRPRGEVRSVIQYRLKGTALHAEVEYRLPDASTEKRNVTIPFTSAKYYFPIGSTAHITARNTGASGELWLEILIDGQLDQGLGFNPSAQHTTNAYGAVSATCFVGVK